MQLSLPSSTTASGSGSVTGVGGSGSGSTTGAGGTGSTPVKIISTGKSSLTVMDVSILCV